MKNSLHLLLSRNINLIYHQQEWQPDEWESHAFLSKDKRPKCPPALTSLIRHLPRAPCSARLILKHRTLTVELENRNSRQAVKFYTQLINLLRFCHLDQICFHTKTDLNLIEQRKIVKALSEYHSKVRDLMFHPLYHHPVPKKNTSLSAIQLLKSLIRYLPDLQTTRFNLPDLALLSKLPSVPTHRRIEEILVVDDRPKQNHESHLDVLECAAVIARVSPNLNQLWLQAEEHPMSGIWNYLLQQEEELSAKTPLTKIHFKTRRSADLTMLAELVIRKTLPLESISISLTNVIKVDSITVLDLLSIAMLNGNLRKLSHLTLEISNLQFNVLSGNFFESLGSLPHLSFIEIEFECVTNRPQWNEIYGLDILLKRILPGRLNAFLVLTPDMIIQKTAKVKKKVYLSRDERKKIRVLQRKKLKRNPQHRWEIAPDEFLSERLVVEFDLNYFADLREIEVLGQNLVSFCSDRNFVELNLWVSSQVYTNLRRSRQSGLQETMQAVLHVISSLVRANRLYTFEISLEACVLTYFLEDILRMLLELDQSLIFVFVLLFRYDMTNQISRNVIKRLRSLPIQRYDMVMQLEEACESFIVRLTRKNVVYY